MRYAPTQARIVVAKAAQRAKSATSDIESRESPGQATSRRLDVGSRQIARGAKHQPARGDQLPRQPTVTGLRAHTGTERERERATLGGHDAVERARDADPVADGPREPEVRGAGEVNDDQAIDARDVDAEDVLTVSAPIAVP